MITTTELPLKNASGSPTGEMTEARKAAEETRETLKTEAREVFGKARESARHRADSCVNATAGKIRNLQVATSRATEAMREEQPDFIVAGANLLSERIATAADYFDRKDSREIADDVADFVRTRPSTSLGILAVAGFCAGRFLKAGGDRRNLAETGTDLS